MSTVRRGATPLLLPTRIREPSAAATPRPPTPAPAPAATPPPAPPHRPPRHQRHQRTQREQPHRAHRVRGQASPGGVPMRPSMSVTSPTARVRPSPGGSAARAAGRSPAGASQGPGPAERHSAPTRPSTPTHRPSRTPHPCSHHHPLHATALHRARRAAPAPARREPGASGDGTGPRPSDARYLDHGADRGRRRGHEDGGAGYATVPSCTTAAPDRPRGPNYRPNPLALTWPRRHSVTWRPPHGNPASPRWPGTSGHHPPPASEPKGRAAAERKSARSEGCDGGSELRRASDRPRRPHRPSRPNRPNRPSTESTVDHIGR